MPPVAFGVRARFSRRSDHRKSSSDPNPSTISCDHCRIAAGTDRGTGRGQSSDFLFRRGVRACFSRGGKLENGALDPRGRGTESGIMPAARVVAGSIRKTEAARSRPTRPMTRPGWDLVALAGELHGRPDHQEGQRRVEGRDGGEDPGAMVGEHRRLHARDEQQIQSQRDRKSWPAPAPRRTARNRPGRIQRIPRRPQAMASITARTTAMAP